MMQPTPADLAAFAGREIEQDQATKALEAATLMVRAYTRGRGFNPTHYLEIEEPDLVAVVISSAARMSANPDHTRSETAGPFQVAYGSFDGWTLPELAILHTYRRRTA